MADGHTTVGNHTDLSELDSDIDLASALSKQVRALTAQLEEAKARIKSAMTEAGLDTRITGEGSRATVYGGTHVGWDRAYLASVLTEEQLSEALVRTPTLCLRIS